MCIANLLSLVDIAQSKITPNEFNQYCNFRSYPKITVVMPSFNQGHFIERSILSVINQNYSNVEFIIIDGGSTDGTVNIIKRYEQYLYYWVSEPDNGQSDALNKGFSFATGDIYCWLNSDDTLLPNTFFEIIKAFELKPDKSIIFGDYLNSDENDEIIEYNYSFDFNLNHFIYEGFHLNSQAMFWRRDVHERFGLFDTELHRTMDYDMILRFGMNEGEKSFYRIHDKAIACFRRHALQKTQGYDDKTHSEHLYIAQKWNTKRFKKPYKWLRFYFRLRRLYWYTIRGGFGYAFCKLMGIKTKNLV